MPETSVSETTLDYTLHRPYEELGPGQKPLERIETEITELAAHIHAATARWLLLIAEFEQRRGWADWGCQSAAHWLMWRCGLSPNAAREKVRVATRLADMPKMTEAFVAGELSFTQVRALSRVANEENEADLLMWARHGTAAQIERMVRSYRQAARVEELGDARVAHASRYLRHSVEPDGSVVIRARLSPEEGALVLRALEEAERAVAETENVSAETPEAQLEENILRAAAEPLGRAYEEGRDRAAAAAQLTELAHATPSGRRAADALVVMAETVLEAGPQPRSGADRNMLVVHADIDALRDIDVLADDSCNRCEITGIRAIPPELARQLGCDASIVTMIEKDGEILSVGRKTRTTPAHIRRALRARDKGCRFPGCNHTRFVDDHHIEHWVQGGETKLTNLVTLCRHHHRFVHLHGYKIIVGDGGTITFVRPDGTFVRDASAEAPSAPGIVEQNEAAGLDINPGTCVTQWQGDAMDYDDAVSHLLWCERNAADDTNEVDGGGDLDGGSTRPTFNPDELGEWLG